MAENAVVVKKTTDILGPTLKVAGVLGLWIGYAGALECVAPTGSATTKVKDAESVTLGWISGDIKRSTAIPLYLLTSTVLYGGSAIANAYLKKY